MAFKLFNNVEYCLDDEKTWLTDCPTRDGEETSVCIGDMACVKELVKDLQSLIRFVEFTPRCDECNGTEELIHTKYGIICATCRAKYYGGGLG